MHGSDFTNWWRGLKIPRARNGEAGEVIASLGPLDGKTVADIGAGTGYFAFPLAKKAAKVIAIDIDQRFLDYIEQRKQAEENQRQHRDPLDRAKCLRAQAGRSRCGADRGHISSHRKPDRILEETQRIARQRRPAGDRRLQETEAAAGTADRFRLEPEQVESELKSAGFAVVSTDRDLLPYQYITKAK